MRTWLIILNLEVGLFSILEACSKLERLDLTSCRGIRVVDRRRFFEVGLRCRPIFFPVVDLLAYIGMGRGEGLNYCV